MSVLEKHLQCLLHRKMLDIWSKMCIRDRAKAALEATTNALKEALIAGDKIQLVGFGTFSINERSPL